MIRIASPIRRICCVCVVVGVLASSGSLAQQTPPASPQTPTFRARTVLVPIDVRVLDGKGKPVTGLTQADFRVFEDGVPQTIGQFAPVQLTAERDREARPLLRTTASAETLPQNRRVFLLLMGRGRLNPVSKGLDALIRFARERVMPQDQLALFAYNRGTDFTTNHEYIAFILERLRSRQDDIEARMRQTIQEARTEVSPIYGRTGVPQEIQVEIDGIFNVPGGPPLRTPNVAIVPDSDRMDRDYREASNALLTKSLAQTKAAMLGSAAALDPYTTAPSEMRQLDTGFGDFVAGYPQSFQELASIYQAIEYLRNIDGEKHLVFVTERGLSLPSLEDHTSVASMASDARVAIDVIQTGGHPEPARIPSARPSPTENTLPTTLSSMFVVRSLNDLSRLTGGQASIYDYANTAIEKS